MHSQVMMMTRATIFMLRTVWRTCQMLISGAMPSGFRTRSLVSVLQYFIVGHRCRGFVAFILWHVLSFMLGKPFWSNSIQVYYNGVQCVIENYESSMRLYVKPWKIQRRYYFVMACEVAATLEFRRSRTEEFGDEALVDSIMAFQKLTHHEARRWVPEPDSVLESLWIDASWKPVADYILKMGGFEAFWGVGANNGKQINILRSYVEFWWIMEAVMLWKLRTAGMVISYGIISCS